MVIITIGYSMKGLAVSQSVKCSPTTN